MPGKLAGRKHKPTFVSDDVVFDSGKNKEVVVTLSPKFMELKLKGQRNGPIVQLSYASLFMRNRLAVASVGGS